MSLKIHLGCGKRDFGIEWLHYDGGNFPHTIGKNVTQIALLDETADLIYACHLIAYFDREEIKPILAEWKRVLKIGGILRLATPDFEKMAHLHYQRGMRLENFLGPLYGRMPMGDQTIYHKTTYDFASLKSLLQEVGFRHVRPYDWRQTEHAKFDDHSQAYLPHMDKDKGTLISLNMEATK